MSSVIVTHQHLSVKFMTIEYEYLDEDEYHSLKETYKLLCDLIDPKKTPAIPKWIRDNAKKCTRHYPHGKDWDKIYETVGFFNPR